MNIRGFPTLGSLLPLKATALVALAFCFCLSVPAKATVSVTANDAANVRVSGSSQYFSYAVDSAVGCPAGFTDVYPVTTRKLDPDDTSSDLISLTVSTDTESTASRYIRVKNTATGNFIRFHTDFDYVELPPNTQSATVYLKVADLCDDSNTGDTNDDCAFDITTAKNLEYRVGVLSASGATFSATCPNDATEDCEDFFINFVRCASYNDDAESGGQYTYTVSAKALDAAMEVSIGGSAPTITGQYPYVGTLILAQQIGTPITSPMAVADAAVATLISGDPSAGTHSISGLENNKGYAVQIAFVNVGGFITPPGPPLPGTQSLHVTPSEVAGVMSEDDCPVLGGGFLNPTDKDDSKKISTLRQFRDKVLMSSVIGRKVVVWYYRLGEKVTPWLRQHPEQSNHLRWIVMPIIEISTTIADLTLQHHTYRDLLQIVMFPAVEFASAALWLRHNLWVLTAVFFAATVAMVMVMNSGRRKRSANEMRAS